MATSTVPFEQKVLPIRTIRVTVVTGPDQGKIHVALGDRIAIGSASDNDLVLADATVSRYHVELVREGLRVRVLDQGSTNSVAVGGVLLNDALIPSGTVLALGKTSVRVEDGDTIDLELFDSDRLGDLRGRSPEMRRLMAAIARVASSDAAALIQGETGVGKELVAESIHRLSRRSDHHFETVDCGALSPSLITSALFGHERGAFTGADSRYVGAFERANRGTIFLDEIGELPLALQANLLGVLERRSFRRVGGQDAISIDVRVISATNRDLRQAVNGGTFRGDLYYRLGVLPLHVPPLRDRREDIPLLLEHFAQEAGHSGPLEEVVPEAVMQQLLAHRWPGNVRELRNFVDAAVAFGSPPPLHPPAEVLQADDRVKFPEFPIGSLLELPYKTARAQILSEFEQLYLTHVLETCEGNVSAAARKSKIHRTYLTDMLKRRAIKK